MPMGRIHRHNYSICGHKKLAVEFSPQACTNYLILQEVRSGHESALHIRNGDSAASSPIDGLPDHAYYNHETHLVSSGVSSEISSTSSARRCYNTAYEVFGYLCCCPLAVWCTLFPLLIACDSFLKQSGYFSECHMSPRFCAAFSPMCFYGSSSPLLFPGVFSIQCLSPFPAFLLNLALFDGPMSEAL
ncbi:hypothetical protein DFP72DRAFT_419160 [Ephemerocybe angulata]|uniref:Uncharacterized protein n=1 Tax=Ephemerocybe angulata TaxID=980116 RepID=A0A8H6IHJ3_9AGAR|nr:hypothetical protein DFP72DRAFT_419160 [Tulosesus angulatus]